MALKFKRSLIVLLYVLGTSSAYAQICKEKGSNSSGNPSNDRVWIDCDHTYRDLSVTCDDNAKSGKQSNVGTRPSCPPKPMPMITTPLKSFIKGSDGKPTYTPYLFAYAREKDKPELAYNGIYSTGTGGGPDKIFSLQGNAGSPDQLRTQKRPTPISTCKDQIRLPKQFKVSAEEDDLRDQAMYERLRFDNCTNQYILQDALFPFQKSRSRLINNPQDSAKYVSLETECQPLKVDQSVANDNEYLISDYVIAAWKKLLKDPKYRYAQTKVKPTMMTQAAIGKAEITMPDVPDNKTEPHLPDKVKIENPIEPPTDYEKVKPSHLAATEYEDITDPSHPFSPRWDFLFNEREYYSPLTDDYQKETKNAVYCAGVKEAKNESDTKKKEDKEVKVDVLSFREKAFTEGIMHRIAFNKICKEDADNNQEQRGEFFSLLFQSYCVKLHPVEMAACLISGSTCNETGTQKPCWKCFKLSGKVDDPPCSTRYDEKDLKVKGALVFPGLYNGFAKKASCNPVYYMRRGKHNIDKLCNNLRKPYTQTNRLKMRYDNPDDKDNNALTAGVQEGFRFSNYFGNHMPYPRVFDIGSSLHKSKQTDTQYQQADDTEGQYTTIVGIGREGAPKSAGDDAQKKHPDERCLLGGWGGKEKNNTSSSNNDGNNSSAILTDQKQDTEFLGIKIQIPDPVTSWTEVKAQKMRTMRLTNLSCIGRHEKVFKTGGTENIVLRAAGGEWSNVVVQKCPKDNNDPKKCTYMSLKEYKNQGTQANDSSHYTIPQQKLENWPLAWRGFIVKGTKGEKGESTGITDNAQFPKFGNTSAKIMSDLMNIELGDIIVLPHGPAPKDKSPGLAKIALVTEVNLWAPNQSSGPPYKKDCEHDVYKKKEKPECYVQVLEADNGKFPDACGTTDNYGEFKTRYYYHPFYFPEKVSQELGSLSASDDCTDTRIFKCRFMPFRSASFYRMREDVRDGCDKEKSKDCE